MVIVERKNDAWRYVKNLASTSLNITFKNEYCYYLKTLNCVDEQGCDLLYTWKGMIAKLKKLTKHARG